MQSSDQVQQSVGEKVTGLALWLSFVGVSRGNTMLGATGLRGSERKKSASERVSERISEREGFRGFQRFLEVLRGFERILEVFRGFSKALSEPLLECHFPLRVVGRVAPNRVAP